MPYAVTTDCNNHRETIWIFTSSFIMSVYAVHDVPAYAGESSIAISHAYYQRLSKSAKEIT